MENSSYSEGIALKKKQNSYLTLELADLGHRLSLIVKFIITRKHYSLDALNTSTKQNNVIRPSFDKIRNHLVAKTVFPGSSMCQLSRRINVNHEC